jgi:hypothetical protein
MIYTAQAYMCRMATMVALPWEDWGGGVLEEAVVGTNYRAAAAALASKKVMESCSSSRRRAMAHTQVQASAAFFSTVWRVAILSVSVTEPPQK